MAMIGIDLGTTNSLAAYWKDGQVQFIPDALGNYLIPSAVSCICTEDEENFLLGARQKNCLPAQGVKWFFPLNGLWERKRPGTWEIAIIRQ